jgi:hypothetical protein
MSRPGNGRTGITSLTGAGHNTLPRRRIARRVRLTVPWPADTVVLLVECIDLTEIIPVMS